MSNSNDESLDVSEELPLPPEDSRDLFVYSSGASKSQHQKFEDGVRYQNNFSRLKQQRDDGQFCDVTFVAGIEGKKIIAHRNILAGAMDYFATMFTSKMKEETDTHVMMAHVRADVLELIVNYCYGDPILITINNVEALYKSAHLMQLNHIVKGCSQFLIEVLHSSNCLRMKLFAELMGDNELLEQAKLYLKKFFDIVIEQQEFKHLNFDELMFLLQRDNLKLQREEFRFRAVKSWVEHNPSERRNLIPSLMSLVQLNLLRPEYLVNTIEDFLPIDPIDKALYIDALKSYLFTYNNKVTLKLPKLIEPTKFGRVLVVGPNVSDPKNSFIECYHPESITWSRSYKMFDCRQDFQIAVLCENLYVIGGTLDESGLNSVMCLNLRTGVWGPSVSMNISRRCFGVAVLDGFIYAIGGRDNSNALSSVERWKPRNTAWENISPTKHLKSNLAVAVLDGMLYAVGGENYQHLGQTETIECYNPSRNEWMHCRTLDCDWTSVGVVAIGTHLCVMRRKLGRTFSSPQSYIIERYHPGTDSWTLLVSLSNTADSIATCLLGERILIVSSYDKMK